jgi:hypothetical protein
MAPDLNVDNELLVRIRVFDEITDRLRIGRFLVRIGGDHLPFTPDRLAEIGIADGSVGRRV